MTTETFDNLRQNAISVSNSYESIIETSNSAINLIISEPTVLQAIRGLSSGKTKGLDSTEKYYSNEYVLLRERINLYYTYKYCYRVIFFNESGDVIASNYSPGNNRIENVDIESINGIDSLGEGEIMIIPLHKDEWDKKNSKRVISVIKRLTGKNMGYFEVQWLEPDMEKLLSPTEPDYEVAIYDNGGKTIFSKNAKAINYYQMILEQEKAEGQIRDKNVLISYLYKNGYYIVLSGDVNYWNDIVLPILPALAALVLLFWFVSLTFANISANFLSKPINTLQRVMTRTDYNNLLNNKMSLQEQQEIRQVIEIENTYKVYEKMVEGLEESKSKAEKMSYLQLKAQLDLMQAQVNPHFIYNVLNIISAKGLMADDESICEMCDNLSKILRYSTNIKIKEATIREEVDYLNDYLMLLKCRYESRLEYSIFIERNIWNEAIPKLALQQLVENTVKHGFTDSIDILKIEVKGVETKNGWFIQIKDNGGGIEKDKLSDIKIRIYELERQLDECKENIEFEIGGMGIFNTYARLYLLYKNELKFDIEASVNGTVVTIGVEKR
ncbi:MAG: histidine kinase [Pseudobutyrivibrio sp.]|nr:histidine kinase [Pseudobutyrivibrio sp.]